MSTLTSNPLNVWHFPADHTLWHSHTHAHSDDFNHHECSSGHDALFQKGLASPSPVSVVRDAFCVIVFYVLVFRSGCRPTPAKTKLSRSTHNNENPSPQPFRLTNLNLNKFWAAKGELWHAAFGLCLVVVLQKLMPTFHIFSDSLPASFALNSERKAETTERKSARGNQQKK